MTRNVSAENAFNTRITRTPEAVAVAIIEVVDTYDTLRIWAERFPEGQGPTRGDLVTLTGITMKHIRKTKKGTR